MHVTRATLIGLLTSLLLILLVLGFSVNYLLMQRQVDKAQQQWCTTLSLLTTTKVTPPQNPRANPSRVFSYDLYMDFVHLKDQLGCGK